MSLGSGPRKKVKKNNNKVTESRHSHGTCCLIILAFSPPVGPLEAGNLEEPEVLATQEPQMEEARLLNHRIEDHGM